MKVTEKISGTNAQTNAWVELIDYNQDDPQDIVGYLPDEPEHSTESTAEADDNPETEEQRQQEQEIFNSFIESLPEGAQPESMAYTPDGYKLFMEHLSGLESSHKYPEKLLLSTLLNYSDQYLDSGSVMPEDDFFLDESLYEEGGELANLPPNQAKIVERIIEHRLEHLPSEIERKLQEALNRMDEPEKPYGFGETPPPSPQSTIMTTVRNIADYRKFAKDPHQFDGVDQFLHEKCLPKLLEANESQTKNRNSMEAIMVMAKYAPETLEGTQSQIIDAAKFINAHFDELRDYDSRYYMTERLANYTYNNPDNETIVDANGNLTDAFQKRVFLDPGVLMNYTLNGTYEDHGYNQRMINITESILSPSQITALRTVSESGFGKASETQSLNIVYGAYGNCETDEDRDRITTSIRALAEKDEHGVPLKIVADIIRRHPEIDFSTTDPESEIETSEAIFAIRSVANSVHENPDRRSTTSLLDRCRLLKRINISNPDTRTKLNQKLVDFVSSKENIDETTVNETIEISRAFERFTNQFTNSNSLEIRRISDEITSELIDSGFIQNEDGSMGLSLDGLHEKADHIEDVFLHNNLPMLAKKLLVFQTLHPPENFDKDFKEKPHLSPTILEADNRGPEGEYGIILRDLIHCSVESNSLELRKYLESLRDGQTVIDRIENGESSFENLSEDEQKLAQSFVLKVITAYNENQPDQNRRLKNPTQLRQITFAT